MGLRGGGRRPGRSEASEGHRVLVSAANNYATNLSQDLGISRGKVGDQVWVLRRLSRRLVVSLARSPLKRLRDSPPLPFLGKLGVLGGCRPVALFVHRETWSGPYCGFLVWSCLPHPFCSAKAYNVLVVAVVVCAFETRVRLRWLALSPLEFLFPLPFFFFSFVCTITKQPPLFYTLAVTKEFCISFSSINHISVIFFAGQSSFKKPLVSRFLREAWMVFAFSQIFLIGSSRLLFQPVLLKNGIWLFGNTASGNF